MSNDDRLEGVDVPPVEVPEPPTTGKGWLNINTRHLMEGTPLPPCTATDELRGNHDVARPVESVPPPWRETPSPEGYEISSAGVLQKAKNGGKVRIAGVLWVSAHTEDPDTGGFGIVVAWRDQRGRHQEQAFPREMLHTHGKGLAQALARRGAEILPGREQDVMAYLAGFEPTRWVASVSRCGWMNSRASELVYVTPAPRGILGAPCDQRVIFQPEQYSPSIRSMHSRGTLEDWKGRVAAPCAGNDYLVFALCVALAAPLLKPARLESGGFHFWGRSSRGKTTLLQVGSSVWGCGADPADTPERAFTQHWNATGNAQEALFASHSDCLITLDEIHTCAEKDFGRLVYNMAGGTGKAALDRERNLRPQRSWRVLLLSSGEESARNKIEAEGRKAHAGQLLRLLDVPTDSGIIASTGRLEPGEFARRLKLAAGQVYGTAGLAFVARLLEEFENAADLSSQVRSRLQDLEREFTRGDLEAEEARVLRRFALAAIAGELGADFDILPFSRWDILQAVRSMINAWLRGGRHLSDVTRGMMAVQAFMLRHESRFRDIRASTQDRPETPNLAGYINRAEGLYLFTPEGFEEACAVSNATEVARELLKVRYLFTHEAGHFTSKHSVASLGKRPRLYAVRAALLEHNFSPPILDPFPPSTGGADGAEEEPQGQQ